MRNSDTLNLMINTLRRAPEFKYPYAVKDSFDVLKWVCISF